jgi:hypothetical protein
MTTLNVPVSEGLEQFLREEAATKGFSNPGEFAEAVLNDVWKLQVRAKLSALLESRYAAVERGEFDVLDGDLIEKLREKLIERHSKTAAP